MYRAIITYKNNKIRWFVANSIDMIKTKAEPYLTNENVLIIEVEKVEDVGYLKHPWLDEIPEIGVE